MNGGPRASPIERFLGAEAMRAGPFGLLRLTPETCTDERIIASLEWQLDRVAQHPEGDTPEADEVRLALHAAAAQLLDPNVRRHVMRSLQRRGEAAPAAPAFTPPGVATASLTGLEQDALRTLAAYGGWNKQSLERLKALAYARGMGSREVAQTLQNLATRRRRQGPRGAAPPTAQAPARGRGATGEAAEEATSTAFVDPGARYVRNLLLGIGGTVAFLLVLVVAAALILTSGGPSGAPDAGAGGGTGVSTADSGSVPGPAPEESGASGDAVAGETRGPAARPEPAPVEVVDPQALVRALGECAASARREPHGAADAFPPLARSLAARWVKLDPAQRRAADVAVLDVVFATASYPDVSARVLEAIGEGARAVAASDSLGPEQTWPGVWSVGILTRLSREREVPHAVSSEIDSALTSAIGQDRPRTGATFESGALAALRRIPERLFAGEPGGTKASEGGKPDRYIRPWVEAVAAIVGSDADARERMLVDALQRILTGGPEPTADQRVFDTVQTLVTEIKWRRGGPARPRLLDWFRDPGVSMQDLQVVTAALASRSSAEGVDSMMVLSVGAAPADRQRLRAAYAKAWGIAESIGESDTSAAWLKAVDAELERTTEGMRATEVLIMGVTLARLNEAAARLWRGEPDEVPSVIKAAVGLPDNPKAGAAGGVRRVLSEGREGDGQWTASYASMGRNAALRQEKLTQMEKYTVTIGPVDAEQLFYLACFETPVDLRATAQRAVMKLANEASMVNAALELLPRAPRYNSVAGMYERVALRRLPAPTEASWELEARRALVARLLELLAAAGQDAWIDDLSEMLFESYAARAGEAGPAEGESSGEPGAARGVEGAAGVARAWRAAAEAVAPNDHAPVTLDVIDRRHQGRRRLAQGPIQQFAAEQVTSAELMAYVVSAEQPRLAAQVKAAMVEMARARRQSSHIFEQVAHTERAMLRLWRLRIAGDQP